MRNLNDEMAQAVAFLESLPDWMAPVFSIEYARTEHFRRKAMEKHGTPVISFSGHMHLGSEKPDPGFSADKWQHFNCAFKVDPCEVIDDIMGQLCAWLEEKGWMPG